MSKRAIATCIQSDLFPPQGPELNLGSEIYQKLIRLLVQLLCQHAAKSCNPGRTGEANHE
jgi:hypothetical protein